VPSAAAVAQAAAASGPAGGRQPAGPAVRAERT
jgi:hypothetical protein